MSGFGGGGFAGASNNNNPFGSGGFGSSNASSGFGNSAGTTNTAPFGSNFGGQTNNTNNPFGSSPSAPPFGGSATSSSFQNASGGGQMSFGTSPNVMTAAPGRSSGFGGAKATFGSQSNTQHKQNSPSSSSGAHFGGSQYQSHQSSTPFGGSSSNSQPIKFGTSSNVFVGNKTNQAFESGGGNNTGSSFVGASSNSGFGNNTGSGFGQQSSSNNKANTRGTIHNPFGGGPSSSDGTAPKFSFSSNISTIPEQKNNDNSMEDNNNDFAHKNTNNAQAQMEEKKRLLQAKIEEKKRLLLEKKKRKQEEAGRRSKSPTLSPIADSESVKVKNASVPAKQQQSLAERNALRFAQQRNQTSVRTQPSVTTNVASAPKEREDLKDAVNLVGLCPTMCPFDELEKRRNESDIQALEIPLPGRLHPSDWTFKDTAIKRFRRSAADYKLDVPEWVRPPEVLERTMGYLEEWIMERDRQGLDPRFPQKDIPPPPLDVYQFIWDRTRMIRKDFILQNYVGTGGRCDAKAVRCHERIARWHAMCEHQLSHIDDFVKMQSQQNMQELGQTMKTLNSFYDDALNRSTKEVPEEKTGRETYVPDTNHTANTASDKNNASKGGCIYDIVQGQSPTDYNGHPLNNTSDNSLISRRLVGDNINNTIARGTAEPEMRGIYMLLTMDNEGGMEVLKYAARLFKERPSVYHSPPVQLALTVFKAKKDMNYIKFFSILRSASTPYLFACIMFKHVEVMRRAAMQIMSFTYGARSKTGETMYDQYPLERLVHVLCFEDMKEAKKTCEFYNVKVSEYTSQRTGEVKEIILWKGSKFRIPKDAEKGFSLRLKPKKMTRTIESKLNGATRLAVCRGEVSGKGAALFDPAKSSNLNPKAVSFMPQSKVPTEAKTIDVPKFDAETHELLMKKKLEEAKLKERKEKERKALEERQRLEKQQIEEQRKKEQRKKELLIELEKRRRKELEEEQKRQQRIEEERRKAQEAQRIKEAKARKDAEEAARKRREMEEQRIREEREKRRRELEHRIAQEKRRKELEEEQRRRKELEDRKREELRLQREARLAREAEEKRKAHEWQKKINSATKLLMWYRWKRTLALPLEISVRSKESLEDIDPYFRTDPFNLVHSAEMTILNNRQKLQTPLKYQTTSKDVIENLLRINSAAVPKIGIANMALQELQSISKYSTNNVGSRKSKHLIKIALICPESMDVSDQSYASLLYHWIGTRVNLGKIEIAKSDDNSDFSLRHEVRALVVRGSSYEVCSTCDIALFVIPPQWTESKRKAAILHDIASSILNDDVPRVVLALNDKIEASKIHAINKVVAKEVGGNLEAIPIIQPSDLSMEAFDSALKSAFHRIAKLFLCEACVSVIRIPALQLATKVIRSVLWQCIPSVVGRDVDDDAIVESSRLSLRFMINELATHSRRNKIEWSLWPAPEFSSEDGIVESYFAESEGLPLQWARCFDQDFLLETYGPLLSVFRGHFRDVYQRIVVDAPITLQDVCAAECAQGQYQRCLEKALVWMDQDPASGRCFLYLPEGLLDVIVNNIISQVKASLSSSVSTNSMAHIPALAAEESTIDSFADQYQQKRDSFEAATTSSQSLAIDASLFLFAKKRLRATDHCDHSLKKRRHEVDATSSRAAEIRTVADSNDVRTSPNFSQSNGVQRGMTVAASQSYTKKLERLLHGNETVELTVGNTVLSRYLRDAPKPQV